MIEANEAADIYSETGVQLFQLHRRRDLFLILTIPLARFTDRLIERDRRRRLSGVGG